MCTNRGKRKHLGAFEILFSKLIGLLHGQMISQIIRLLRDKLPMQHLTLHQTSGYLNLDCSR
jgi:hypothetical protein